MIEKWKADAMVQWFADHGETEAAKDLASIFDENQDLHKALAHVLGSLIGATSILRYAHADNITPREVVASDMIFFQTLTDYDNVIEMGRKALS